MPHCLSVGPIAILGPSFTRPSSLLSQDQGALSHSPPTLRPPTAFDDAVDISPPEQLFETTVDPGPLTIDEVSEREGLVALPASISALAADVDDPHPNKTADTHQFSPSPNVVHQLSLDAVQDELRCWDPMEDEWASGRNNYAVDVDNAAVAIDGFVAEQTPICKYYEVRGTFGLMRS